MNKSLHLLGLDFLHDSFFDNPVLNLLRHLLYLTVLNIHGIVLESDFLLCIHLQVLRQIQSLLVSQFILIVEKQRQFADDLFHAVAEHPDAELIRGREVLEHFHVQPDVGLVVVDWGFGVRGGESGEAVEKSLVGNCLRKIWFLGFFYLNVR